MKTFKNYGIILMCLMLTLSATVPAFSQSPPPSTFKHEATSSNVTNNFTVIDNAATNNRPNNVLFIAHDYGSSGPYITAPLGVWYNNNKWIIFTQDRSPMPKGAKFNVLSQTLADKGVFVHTATSRSISAHITTIDNAATNGRPNAKLIVTQNWGSSGPYNNNPIGVYYDNGKWKIFNQNLVAMPTNAKFNVIVDHPKSFQHVVSAKSTGHITELNTTSTNNSPSAFVFTTQLWQGVYNKHNQGVWYNANKWKVYNEDRVALPSSSKFNVIAFSLSKDTPSTGMSSASPIVIPKTVFTGLVNTYLRSMQIKLNNMGSRHRDSAGDISWFVDNESFVLLGGRRFDFGIPEYTRGVRDKKYYINDMNLSSANTSFTGDELHMILTFEENGSELKGMCSNCAKFREDNAAPDYQFENNRWDVQLNVIPFDGSLTIEVVDVTYLGSVDGVVFGELFDGIVRRTVIPIMENEFRDAFNAQRAQIATEIRTLADRAGFDLASITRISFEGGNIVLHTNRS